MNSSLSSFSQGILLAAFASLASAQLETYDLSRGNFYITCSKGSYCIMPEDTTFTGIAWGPTDPLRVEKDDRFSPDDAYFFVEADGAHISGVNCTSDACYATCSSACTCNNDPTNNSTFGFDLNPEDPNVMACPINATLPDASITPKDELVTYQSGVQSPDLLSLRCLEPYAICSFTDVAPGSSYFQLIIFPEDSADFNDATDFSDCSDGGTCYETCDPRCTCSEVIFASDNSSTIQPCTVGSPPTMAPSMAPTVAGQTERPTHSSSAGIGTKRDVNVILAGAMATVSVLGSILFGY